MKMLTSDAGVEHWLIHAICNVFGLRTNLQACMLLMAQSEKDQSVAL